MEFTRQIEILAIANFNLTELFKEKHKLITLDEIEQVYSRNVLGMSVDAKTKKGLKKGFLTGIMYFAPAKLSGIEVCPSRSLGCTSACLFTAGRGRFYSITRQRVIKTLAFHFNQQRFIEVIKKSIRSLLVKAKNKGLIPVVRLNGTSDILWERNTDILQTFPNVQFYDYTKVAGRFNFPIPSNYHLTFSMSENNELMAASVLKKGFNVAIVFRTTEYPTDIVGYEVINGDTTDLRFLDKKGCIVALKAKGKAKKDVSGFVKDFTPSCGVQNAA
jgi:hypothetical protein